MVLYQTGPQASRVWVSGTHSSTNSISRSVDHLVPAKNVRLAICINSAWVLESVQLADEDLH